MVADRGMVMEDHTSMESMLFVRSLSGKQMLRFMTVAIVVCLVVVVVVVVVVALVVTLVVVVVVVVVTMVVFLGASALASYCIKIS